MKAMNKAVNRAGCTRQDERTLAMRTGEDKDFTHEGGEHRWKQSRIRGDA